MLTLIQTIAGMPHTGASLERLEPCEGKLSRTVLRGRGRVNRLRLPGAAYHDYICKNPRCCSRSQTLRWFFVADLEGACSISTSRCSFVYIESVCLHSSR